MSKTIFLVLLTICNANGLFQLNIEPGRQLIYEKQETQVVVSIMSTAEYLLTIPLETTYRVTFTNDNKLVIKVPNDSIIFSASDVTLSVSKNITVLGLALGFAHIGYEIEEYTDNLISDRYTSNATCRIEVLDQVEVADKVLVIISAVVILLHTFLSGCNLSLDPIAESLKRPRGLVVGLVCQFIISPLICFGVAVLVFQDKLLRLGLFAIGICPGGLASVFYTQAFKGDTALSITLTLVSTFAAIGSMPFWTLTLTRSGELKPTDVTISYTNLLIALAIIAGPMILGVLIRRCRLEFAKALVEKTMKPMGLFASVLRLTVGIFTIIRLSHLWTTEITLAGFLVTLLSYLIGALLPSIFCVKMPQIITICLETALQNGAIAFVWLKLTVPAPFADIASLPSIATLCFTHVILIAGYCISCSARKATTDAQCPTFGTKKKQKADKQIKEREKIKTENDSESEDTMNATSHDEQKAINYVEIRRQGSPLESDL